MGAAGDVSEQRHRQPVAARSVGKPVMATIAAYLISLSIIGFGLWIFTADLHRWQGTAGVL
jgi:hypothetical protein